MLSTCHHSGLTHALVHLCLLSGGAGRNSPATGRGGGGRGRGGNRGGRGGRGGRDGGGGRALSQSDLDKDLDGYMMKDKDTGKKHLDNDLDSYFKAAKSAPAAAAPAAAAAEPAAEVAAMEA